ncbi:HAD family hydrolase [Bradyrhizobium cosmicum]|uniref:HAD family hydrolase n=1 Tax=Bradyrhizobium cosmicum TaxID=1404864 RepID=A0AAI8Q9Z7_9BRAD|nr:HAD family hydrolase [Bradyrhizobium cosmicum]BAL73751.1 hypothetical protein S23_05300 [Bradyrhizobium cosmicum]
MSTSADNRPLLFADADNTLWDTNKVYADAQLRLLADIERISGHHITGENRLDWLRQLDQEIAQRHHARLRYPPRLLAKAAFLALGGENLSGAAKLAWSGGSDRIQLEDVAALQVEKRFLENLEIRPPLREGVLAGLKDLHNAGISVLVVTEAHRERVLELLDFHAIAGYINRVIEVRKEKRTFDRVLKLVGNPRRAFMIGDQLDRDILPAKEAGLATILFPGGFQPKWQSTYSHVQPDHQVTSFSEAVKIVLDE